MIYNAKIMTREDYTRKAMGEDYTAHAIQVRANTIEDALKLIRKKHPTMVVSF